MHTRRLGETDLKFTALGLGTWAIGGPWDFGWGPQSDKDSIAAIRQALDLGINWVDTAPVYGLGHAEEIVGRAIEGRRDQVIIATKCGMVWNNQRKVSFLLKADSIRQEVEASLRRLNVDVIDLYQIHWPNPDADISEAFEAIGKLVDQGKARYAGVSNFSTAQLERVATVAPVASLQPPYSMLDRDAELELLPYCAEHNIGVIAYGPLAFGLLTGKYSLESVRALPKDDWRHRGARFNEPELSANLDFIDGIKAIAERNERHLAQLAIAWVLRRTEITSAIVGARHPSQIVETVGAADWAPADSDFAAIDQLLMKRDAALQDHIPAAGP